MTKVFSNIPFFRTLIPFVVGILLAINFRLDSTNSFILITLICTCVILLSLKTQNNYTKRAFLISSDVFFFLLAINIVNTSTTFKQSNFYGNYIKADSANCFIATISDLPIEKEKFIKCKLEVNEVGTDLSYKKVKGTLIGYFKRSDAAVNLKVGQTLLIKTKLLEVDEPKNPFEFDYKNYLSNKQIYHTAFINKQNFEVLDVPLQLNLIWYKGLVIKDHILKKLKNSQLSVNAFGICAALLTGYDDEIDKQVVDSFSHSGTLHVLSVSGLHTGLIYLVLSFLFDLLDRKRNYKIIKFLLITCILWGFALITGFSAPVLRAVIMFNLLGFGKIFFRSDNRNQINILLVSAFILLCYDPFFITDIGFLLSYFAVFGLLYYQPKLATIWHPTNTITNWFWQGTTASFAATISTLPFTLFYFKQFPLWFFLSNIVVVPASFVILLLALLLVLKLGIAAIIINYLTSWLISFITIFNSSKFGYIDSIDFNFVDAIFLSFFIILLSIAIQNRSYKQISYSFILLICWQISALLVSYNSKGQDLFVVYQINKHTNYLVKNNSNARLNALDSSKFNYHVKPHIISFNNPNLEIRDFNFVKTKNKNILILNKANFWPDLPLQTIDVLVLANNFKLTPANLEDLTHVKTIVLDGSNNNYSSKKTEELCRKFEIELIKTKQKGAYILNL
jgi:competence protein ComEC